MAENLNLGMTMEAWAALVIEIWEERIEGSNFKHSTGQLLESLYHHVNTEANGNPKYIEFAFHYYGIMVDLGVGGMLPWQIGMQ